MNAAHDGDKIAVGRGRFPGGVTIDKSIKLAGAGRRRRSSRAAALCYVCMYLAPDRRQ